MKPWQKFMNSEMDHFNIQFFARLLGFHFEKPLMFESVTGFILVIEIMWE